MAAEFPSATTSELALDNSRLTREGLIAGTLGAATLALWFLILDLLQGRPLLTPTILGTLFLKDNTGLNNLDTLAIAPGVVVAFTFIHWVVFVLLGLFVAWLLSKAERNPNLGFGILMLFVFFEVAFLAGAMIFAQPVLQALTWPTILIGNLLAASSMGGYLWRQHRHLTMHP